jgi:hypothetical protein
MLPHVELAVARYSVVQPGGALGIRMGHQVLPNAP